MSKARFINVLAATAAFFAALGGLTLYAWIGHARQLAAAELPAELDCLARNIYYEARGEPLVGQYAVAEVTMNRVLSPLFPDTVCDVVYAGRYDTERDRFIGAFSWTADKDTLPEPYGYEWRRASAVAESVHASREAPFVDGALFYHATYVTPNWARSKYQVALIGRHLFYH